MMSTTAFSVEHLKQIYEATRVPQAAERENFVVRSWARCLDYGLDPSRAQSPHIVPKQKMRERQEALVDLIARSRLEMTHLFASLNNDRCALVLTDAEGLILLLHGEQKFLEQARRQGLVEGAMWNERYQGTNGMGTCLQEQAPVLINQGQHFFTCHANLNCAAAPIFDPQGRLSGAFDLSSDSLTVHQHTVALLAQCARRISHYLFRQHYKNEVLVQLRAQADNDLDQILLAIGPDGRILAATREALFANTTPGDAAMTTPGNAVMTAPGNAATTTPGNAVIMTPGSMAHPSNPSNYGQLIGQSIEQVVDMPWERFRDTLSHDNGRGMRGIQITPDMKINGHWVSLQMPMTRETRKYSSIITKSIPATANRAVPMSAEKERQREVHQPIMKGDGEQEVRKGLKAVHSLMPLLISGERGCGKRTLAAFLHGAGPLAAVPLLNVAGDDGPLVVKMLQQLEQLEESRAPWNVIIEDIATMALPQQARLAQILDKNFTGKGSGHSGQIYATSFAGLAELQRNGQLHERLCCQFSAFHLDLLPLRLRVDKRTLVAAILKRVAGDQPQRTAGNQPHHVAGNQPHHVAGNQPHHMTGNQPRQLAPEVWEKFDQYPWPGNVRELCCALQAALALAGDEKILQLEHFPSLRSHSVELLAPNDFNPLDRAARAALLAELERLDWNISKLARALNVSRNTIYRKVRRLGIPLAH